MLTSQPDWRQKQYGKEKEETKRERKRRRENSRKRKIREAREKKRKKEKKKTNRPKSFLIAFVSEEREVDEAARLLESHLKQKKKSKGS